MKSFGLEEAGVELSTSGWFIDDISPQLDALRSEIISGQIDVPVEPADRFRSGHLSATGPQR
jgi:basic membrane protein A